MAHGGMGQRHMNVYARSHPAGVAVRWRPQPPTSIVQAPLPPSPQPHRYSTVSTPAEVAHPAYVESVASMHTAVSG